MKNKLIQLKNTLGMIETKGESTLIMADCMRFISQLIEEVPEEVQQTQPQFEGAEDV